MANFWNRVAGIKAQQASAASAKQTAAISKAQDFWNRVDGIKAQQASSSGSWPSASEVIRNSGYDPAMVAFTQSPFYGKSSGIDINGNDLTAPKVAPRSGSGSGGSASSFGGVPVSPQTLDYLNAELASHYGMSRETAYQEALSNTSYQRAVADMKRAGLNPAVLFGEGRVVGADGVGLVRAAATGGGGGGGSSRSGGSRGSSSGKSSNGKLFDSGIYYGISAAAGVATAVTMGNPNGFWIGSTVAQGIMGAANSFWKR